MPGTELTLSPALAPAPLFAPTPEAARHFLDFFTARINNAHTRRAYLHATRRFSRWCETNGIGHLREVKPFHIACFLQELQSQLSPPTVKQSLAALRMLFDWLVTGHVLDVNPAHAVRGPKHSVKKGKTPVLSAEEARALLDAIETDTLIGLRDRALIGLMVYTFARINAALSMTVADYYVQGRRGWVRLGEKGGKQHQLPCHHKLEQYLDEYLAAAGGDPHTPLFRTAASKTGRQLTGSAMRQQDAYRMVRRRAGQAGIRTRIGNHTFRATGITAYLRNGGTLETAQQIAAHESPRTTKLYDRRGDELTWGEIERIGI